MAKQYKIVDHDHLIRDGHSKALLLTDPKVLAQDRVRRALKEKNQELEIRLNRMDERMSRIENLLIELAKNK